MTTTLLAITLIASVICFQRRDIMSKLIFNPAKIQGQKEWYRFITSGFIHADWTHLIVNMIAFYFCGLAVEYYYKEVFGDSARTYYLILYFGGMVMSVYPSYLRHREDPYYNALGASGAVSAVLFAFILFDPLEKIYLFYVLPMPAIVFGVLYLVYCYYAARNAEDNINHDAHFWGALFGISFTLAMKPALFPYFIEQIKSAFA